MKKYFFLSLLLFSGKAWSQNGLAEMIQSEKRFAAYSVVHGTKEAFLQFADTTATMFSNGEPVNGYQLWLKREQRPGVLNWRPRYAEIAASGDFGYTCGPWTFQPQTTTDPVIAHGYFFTVWRKNSAGDWKFILDVGTDAGPLIEDTTVVIQSTKTSKGLEITMLEAESDFIRLFKKDSASAYRMFFSEKSLLAREATGFDKTKSLQAPAPESGGVIIFSALGSGMAPSSDLGFVYGTALLNGKKDAYLRIWRHEPKGWKIALQMMRL